MDVYEGYSVTQGSALASVAKVRFDFGIASFTPQRLRSLGERLMRQEQDGYVETEEIILVADSLPLPLLTGAIPGIEVVGVAVGGYLEESEVVQLEAMGATIPIVAGLGAPFVREAAEGDIVLVDGLSGRVYFAPDADVVARFQASTSRKRYFIEGVHIQAKSASDNRVVPVIAVVRTFEDIETAMQSGADGIYLSPENELLGGDLNTSKKTQLAVLVQIIDGAGGKPVLIDVPAERLALSALLEASSGAPTAIVVADSQSADDALAGLDTARTFATPDARLGDVDVLLAFEADGNADDLPENIERLSGLLLRQPLEEYPIEYLIAVLGLARRAGKPTYTRLADSWSYDLEASVRLGIERVVVPATEAADVKDAIREL